MSKNNNPSESGEIPLVDDFLEQIEVSRVLHHLPEANMDVDNDYFDLFQEAEALRRNLVAAKQQGVLISPKDINLVLQKYNAAIAISNELDARNSKASLLSEFPEAGKKKNNI